MVRVNEFIAPMTIKYFKNIGKFSALTEEEQRNYLEYYIKTKDEMYLKPVIECNLKLVVYEAKKYINMGVAFDDLINSGNIGLITGLKKIKLEFNNKISTYIGWWIRQAIAKELADNSRLVKLPYNRHCEYIKLKKDVDEKEISDKDRVELFEGKSVCNLEDEFSVNDNSMIEHEKAFEDNQIISMAIDTLEADERLVLTRLYGFNGNNIENTISEIAAILSLSEDKIKRIKKIALKKMKKSYISIANNY
jgi:RNA polymerase primary sigma factor